MSVDIVKAICRRIRQRYGSNESAALAAGCHPSTWSRYCNDADPASIPFVMIAAVANASERAAFIALLQGDDTPPGDVLDEASEMFETAGDAHRVLRSALRDGTVTPLEKRAVRQRVLAVQAEAADVLAALDATTAAQRPTLKAV